MLTLRAGVKISAKTQLVIAETQLVVAKTQLVAINDLSDVGALVICDLIG